MHVGIEASTSLHACVPAAEEKNTDQDSWAVAVNYGFVEVMVLKNTDGFCEHAAARHGRLYSALRQR